MRRRVVSGTGLGNPDRHLLNNSGKLNKKFAKAALTEYFSKWEGFDFHVNNREVRVGIEPAYQYERLLIICIAKNMKNSYIRQGRAFGGYGSQLGSTTKTYAEYKNNCKFTRFVKKWHPILFGGK